MPSDSELKETIELLTFLLNEEFNERNIISGDLHGKSAGLGASKLWLEIWGSKSKTHLSTSTQLIKIIDECMVDIKRIVIDIYPRIIIRKGLIVSLKEYIHDKNKVPGSRIDLLTTINDNEQLKITLLNETAIYKICTSVTEFMLLVPLSSIQIRISAEAEFITLHITGTTQKTNETLGNREELAQKMTRIKALIRWQQANILPETNWFSGFGFSFKIPPEKP